MQEAKGNHYWLFWDNMKSNENIGIAKDEKCCINMIFDYLGMVLRMMMMILTA